MNNKGQQRRLVVNADDFGLDSAINLGIIEAFEKGIVTNTSLSVCGRAFDEALQLANRHKMLGVGIHLTINEEKPILPREKVWTLLYEDENSFLGYHKFLRRFFSGNIRLEQIYSEFEAQIQKFIKTGLKPTHLDSHGYVHLYPKIFDITIDLAKKYNISWLRIARIPIINALKSSRGFRRIKAMGLSIIARTQSWKLKRHMMHSADYCYGVIDSGLLNKERLIQILNCLPIGTSELICHPGYKASHMSDCYKFKYDWLLEYDWLTELNALTNQVIKNAVRDLNIQLIRYDEI